MPYNLRPAGITDLPAVYRGELSYIRRCEPAHEQAWHLDVERHLTRWVTHMERLTVAEADRQVVGYVLWLPEGEQAELCTLSVSDPYRRRGIGQALLAHYMNSSRQQGYVHHTLSVRADNPARHLYEQAGFVQTGVDAHGYLRYWRV